MSVHNILILTFYVSLFPCSCTKGNEHIGKELVLNAEEYAAVRNPRALDENDSENKAFTMVTYFGAGNCSVCALKMMPIWDYVADELGRENVQYRFVFSNSDGTPTETIEYVLKQYFFSFPIWIDNNDAFSNDNPFVSELKAPTCFLLDSNGVVLDYGRPDLKKRDYKRFWKKIR